jgi:hypothetical protein
MSTFDLYDTVFVCFGKLKGKIGFVSKIDDTLGHYLVRDNDMNIIGWFDPLGIKKFTAEAYTKAAANA